MEKEKQEYNYKDNVKIEVFVDFDDEITAESLETVKKIDSLLYEAFKKSDIMYYLRRSADK